MDGHLPTLRLKLGIAVSYSPYRAQHHPQSPRAYPLPSCPPLPPTKATAVLGPSWSHCLSRLTPTILHVGEGADGLSPRQDLNAINVLQAACLQPSSALRQPVLRSRPAQRSLLGVTRPRSSTSGCWYGTGHGRQAQHSARVTPTLPFSCEMLAGEDPAEVGRIVATQREGACAWSQLAGRSPPRSACTGE